MCRRDVWVCKSVMRGGLIKNSFQYRSPQPTSLCKPALTCLHYLPRQTITTPTHQNIPFMLTIGVTTRGSTAGGCWTRWPHTQSSRSSQKTYPPNPARLHRRARSPSCSIPTASLSMVLNLVTIPIRRFSRLRLPGSEWN